MNSPLYQLRIVGLEEAAGQIKRSHLEGVLKALAMTAKSATRLRVTGSGSTKRKEKWLADTVDFTLSGLQPGSTTLQIASPPLRATVGAKLLQQQLFATPAQPPADATALDLVTDAVNEAQAENPAGDYFDNSVLEAILKFKKIAGASVGYELTPLTTNHAGFLLDESKYQKIHARLQDTPPPKSVIVSGMLNEIKHADGHFRLVLADQSKIIGRMDDQTLEREKLRELWGKPTTVSGLLHSKANGQPRLIEAQRIAPQVDGDQVFERLPMQTGREQLSLLSIPTSRKPRQSTDPMILWNTWPGDESIEDLLAQLD